jgi:hypothetical protein
MVDSMKESNTHERVIGVLEEAQTSPKTREAS